MRILLVQDAEWRKKGPHHQHHFMEQLSLKGHDILVIGFDQLWKEDAGGIISKREVVHNVCRFYKGAKITFIRPSFIRIPTLDYISFLFSSGYEIKNQVELFDPDIIIGLSSVLSNFWGMLLARKTQTPFIYYWLDVIHELSIPAPFKPIAILIEKIIIKNSDVVAAINEGLRDYLIEFGANPSTTCVIHGGIDFGRFKPSAIDSVKVRSDYGFTPKDIVLFFMGWIFKFSGLKELVLELSRNKENYRNVKVLIVGEGDYYSELKNLIETLNMHGQVILTGKKPYEEIPQLIAAADICLLPAYNNEIMDHIVPIKMYEYLAMHKPIISTRLPGIIKEFGYESGIIYVDSPEDAIKATIKLSKEDTKLNGLKASEFIKNYDWTYIVNEFESFLENIVQRGTIK